MTHTEKMEKALDVWWNLRFCEHLYKIGRYLNECGEEPEENRIRYMWLPADDTVVKVVM